ncbi:ras-related protein Rab-24-like isoform X2 [Saccostrea echinata]|uniref:ras-related protein Rab-24-like isoform X1 n=1 Tax=Saccostrea echinata TaxID=191078 RepID=UPI002A809F6A|nr:ras-related protein Rab-24-like isoform X1 [Saccostrea echinata]XP_061194866.1 ras-related protein Rab-24-like isoform X2 [Saccostrea echinata]
MNFSQNNECDFALKVVIIGATNAGKTCLVRRYIHNTFVDNTSQTIGAAFVSKKIQALGKRVTLNIWDTAGSERYQSMTKMYYRGARAAILCYDLTDKSSFDKIRYWVGELQENEQFCRMYICGTKKDLIDNDPKTRAVSADEAQVIAQDLQTDFFETSSLTGENVEAVFQRIGEDYIRNMHSYPENQPKTQDNTQESFHVHQKENTQPSSSCMSCFKR